MFGAVEISIVVPVFNGSRTIEALVQEIRTVFCGTQFEIVLVNDGSTDDSEDICRSLARRFPGIVTFVQLSRNFGEHNAVLAGLGCAKGAFVGVLDDDGQNPPAELLRLWHDIEESGDDVVYGRHLQMQSSWFRRFGSWFNDVVATVLIGKPSSLYFSSFKVMSRCLVREIIKCQSPFPYLDGLIFQSTSRISQVDVLHRPREHGRSGYTLRKLVRLWLNMCLGFSIVPLRFGYFSGAVAILCGVLVFSSLLAPDARSLGILAGSPVLIAGLLVLTGMQMLILGVLGEYLGRMHLQQSGISPFVIRYIEGGGATDESRRI